MEELIIGASEVFLTHEIGSAFGVGLAEARFVIRPVRIQTRIQYDGHFTKNSTHVTYQLFSCFFSSMFIYLINNARCADNSKRINEERNTERNGPVVVT